MPLSAHSVQRLSQILQVTVLALAIGLAGCLMWVYFDPRNVVPDLPDRGWTGPYSLTFLWGFIALGTALSAVGFLALWRLYALVRCFAEGTFLTQTTVRAVQKLGHALIYLALAKIAFGPLSDLWFIWISKPETGQVSLSVSSEEVGFLLVSGVLALVGHALREGVAAASENKGFI
ncbi:hypothetical protein [Nereida sp. MMG025]|uniref:hypothetical protein n=1 Tax=Nereida sp. MMG025 TaxID=2909981 RepID=UPI001F398807|nr:hypothetical protein [Nereida sp. MMG025]MCF6444491.1 hypothetical protein [Nereida sp. MMG025]